MIFRGSFLIHSNLFKTVANFSMVSIKSNVTGTLSQFLRVLSATSEDFLDKGIVESIYILILFLSEDLM